ncbi:hypothetical protein ANCCAN_29304 [Ancylostoma caninum]|uniref:Uncharacterized protein n=1 Tax=Ancylostoma caninum TaxID=29170 RepID=A0A368F482_ANCCA|nr:hypothetical protein ANCCAN_29304 [Ancylostoma caninum]
MLFSQCFLLLDVILVSGLVLTSSKHNVQRTASMDWSRLRRICEFNLVLVLFNASLSLLMICIGLVAVLLGTFLPSYHG